MLAHPKMQRVYYRSYLNHPHSVYLDEIARLVGSAAITATHELSVGTPNSDVFLFWHIITPQVLLSAFRQGFHRVRSLFLVLDEFPATPLIEVETLLLFVVLGFLCLRGRLTLVFFSFASTPLSILYWLSACTLWSSILCLSRKMFFYTLCSFWGESLMFLPFS
jgi:hypothetical protein